MICACGTSSVLALDKYKKVNHDSNLKTEPPVGIGQGPDQADPEVLLHHGHVLAAALGVQQLVVL